jgi:DNA-binding MarR family transcriptional regulator
VKRSSGAAEVSELTDHIGFWLRFVSNHVSYGFSRRLQDYGVTVAEWVVMRELYGCDAMSPSDLAAKLDMTRGAISKLVERLVEKKLISRRGREDDRRYQEIKLTSAGRQLLPKLAGEADRNDEEFFAPLTKKEQEQLAVVLKKLVKAHELKHVPTE